MRNHKIIHVCGHEENHLLQGGKPERERQVETLALTACGKCRHEARQRRQNAAAEWAKSQDLSELQGTPRQVAAAELSRHDALTSCALRKAARNAAAILRGTADERAMLPKPVRAALSMPGSAAAMLEVAEYTENLLEELRQETSAQWWESRRQETVWREVENKVQRMMTALKSQLKTDA